MKRRYSILILLSVFFFIAGCQVAEKKTVAVDKIEPQAQYIKIASFNIQVFGQSKINKPDVMEIIARIIREFDVVAIQEVRSSDDNVIPTLLGYVNNQGCKYDYLISKRLGKTSSKEQYAVVYNTKTVSSIPNASYVVDDSKDVFERAPFVAYLKSGNFDFEIVDNHIKPENAAVELNQLSSVLNKISGSSSEKDIIAVGDMNADGSYFNENNLAKVFPSGVQLIDNNQDTTVANSNNTYDRMIIPAVTSESEYAGKAGVFRWDTIYGITDHNLVKKVSDHYPVYALFRTDLPDDD